jgi:hypothetical protein
MHCIAWINIVISSIIIIISLMTVVRLHHLHLEDASRCVVWDEPALRVQHCSLFLATRVYYTVNDEVIKFFGATLYNLRAMRMRQTDLCGFVVFDGINKLSTNCLECCYRRLAAAPALADELTSETFRSFAMLKRL